MVEIMVPVSTQAVQTSARFLGLTPKKWLLYGGAVIVTIVAGYAIYRLVKSRSRAKTLELDEVALEKMNLRSHNIQMQEKADALQGTMSEMLAHLKNQAEREGKRDAILNSQASSLSLIATKSSGESLDKILAELRNSNKISDERQAIFLAELQKVDASIKGIKFEFEPEAKVPAAVENKPSKNGAKPPRAVHAVPHKKAEPEKHKTA